MAVVSHYNLQRAIDIFGSVQDRDLGGVPRDINRIVDANRKKLPRGSQLFVRGQIETMRTSFQGLAIGTGARDRAGLFADRREFPILAGSVHHSYVAARGAWRESSFFCSLRAPP